MIGISGLVFSPKVTGERYLGSIRDFSTLSLQTEAVGGFWSGAVDFKSNVAKAEDWLEMGLGRQIEFYDQGLNTVWKGFTNKITVTEGAHSDVVGPLLDVNNRGSSTYTPRDFTVDPPVDGTQTTTIITENLDSQAKYGILEGILSAGATTQDIAEMVRDRFLQETSLPKSLNSLNFSPGGKELVSTSLELLGNVHWLTKYIYEETGTNFIALSQKLINIILADPNAIFSTNTNLIEVNSYLLKEKEVELRMAWDIIMQMLSIGSGANDNRRMFGVFEKNIVKYASIPTTVAYIHKLSDPSQKIVDYTTGTLIHPWMVRPARWISVPDYMIGRRLVTANTLRGDPRTRFIERVNFTAPYTLDLSGGATDTLAQMLSKITYSGGIY